MAAPTILSISPTDGDLLVPIASTIVIETDQPIDIKTAKNHIVLYGGQDLYVAGPFASTSITESDHRSDAFMSHPSLTGVVETELSIVYRDGAGDAVELTPFSEAGEAGHTYYIEIKPEIDLAANSEYKLRIVGDSDALDEGISKRTVYSPEPDAGNAGSGEMFAYGGYTGASDDSINIEITETGNVGTAEFSWWLDSAPTEVYEEKVTHRRFRIYHEGVQFRFAGSDYQIGDVFTIQIRRPEYLADSYEIGFTTNDGTYSTAPDSPSTPPETLPPAELYPESSDSSTTTTTPLTLDSADPFDGHYRVLITKNVWTFEFSEDLDAATVTDDTVTVYSVPAMGINQFTGDAVELAKKLTVSGKTLTIEV